MSISARRIGWINGIRFESGDVGIVLGVGAIGTGKCCVEYRYDDRL